MQSLTLFIFHRFLRQFILFFAVHLASVSMFRFVASVFRTMVASATAGSFTILLVLLFGGFIIPQRKDTTLSVYSSSPIKIYDYHLNYELSLFCWLQPPCQLG